MKILALDSSATVATVALFEDGELLAEFTLNNGNTHSETLLPMVESVLKTYGETTDGIDVFAATTGPGSFTGVRIGAATVKGLAFGYDKPCVGVSATEALAYNFIDFNGVICPSMDARRSQLYNALFRSENGVITRLTPDRTIPASELASELSSYSEPIYINGGGEHIIRKASEGNPNIMPTSEILKHQNGYSVALCALNKYENSENKDGFTDLALQPTYLRPSQAERMRNGEKD